MKKFDPEIEALIGAPAPKAKRGRRPGEGGKPPTTSRDRANNAQAVLNELKAAQMRHELIDRNAVLQLWAGIVSDLRAGLLAAPARIGAKCALPPEAVAELDAEIRELLTALAGAEALPRE